MLAITRRPAEGVCIGTDIHATVLGFQDRKVQLDIQAPPELEIFSDRPSGQGAEPVCRHPAERRRSRLACRPGQGLWIGDRIFVFVFWVKGRQVRLGIQAPNEIEILRDELVGSPAGQGHARPRQAPARAARGVPLLMQGKGRAESGVSGRLTDG
jgi:sRNA-binding carbon storage regulator CsrA